VPEQVPPGTPKFMPQLAASRSCALNTHNPEKSCCKLWKIKIATVEAH